MRSLFLRWGVAVVVGTLWGAMLSPRSPGTRSAAMAPLASDAAHYARSTKATIYSSPSGDNPPSL